MVPIYTGPTLLFPLVVGRGFLPVEIEREVELRLHAIVGQQVHGLLGVGGSDVGPDLGLCEHEGCGEGGAACPCRCWTASSWATGGL